MIIVKKNTHRSSIESLEVTLKETTIQSVDNEAPYFILGNKDELHA